MLFVALCLYGLVFALPAHAFLGIEHLFGFGSAKRWTAEGLVQLGTLGLPQNSGNVIALGDVDGNQLTDLFVLSQDQQTLSLYIWNKGAYAFQKAAMTITSNNKITNVVPADFNRDGRLDLLVMSQNNPGSWFDDDTTHLELYLNKGDLKYEGPIQLPLSVASQPMLVDAAGDMSISLLGSSKATPSSWSMWTSQNTSLLSKLVTPPLLGLDCKMPNPHSNAFVDLDGDCLADIFLTCASPTDDKRLTYQIWLNKKEQGFLLSQSGDLPEGAGTVSFADMDRDGTIDMVFPSCINGHDCHINIAYNKQMPLCSQPAESNCRPSDQLCISDSSFKFDLTPTIDNVGFSRIPLTSILPTLPYFMLEDKTFSGKLPISIKLGDYDQDGYPDLFVIASASPNPASGNVQMLKNVPCSANTCSNIQISSGSRTFEKATRGAEALDQIKDAKLVSFLDIDEKGSLDLLIQREYSGPAAARTFTFLKNNYYHDAFFLKALLINGACPGQCRIPESGQKYSPFGAAHTGASYKFTVFDPAGRRRATQVAQLSQTSYVALSTPFAYFGLGRTNNYVENFFAGSTRHQRQHYSRMEGLIPNSQVVVIPWQAEGSYTPDSWTKQLYLHPGEWIPGVTLSLIGSLIVLVITIAILHARELREDEVERKKKQTVLNFDAL